MESRKRVSGKNILVDKRYKNLAHSPQRLIFMSWGKNWQVFVILFESFNMFACRFFV